MAAAIDRYVYITLHTTFVNYLIVKYSKLESVTAIEELQHPIIREALKMLEVPCRRLEIASMADIPAGTGLGSSGSFTTALLRALHAYQKNIVSPQAIAEQACQIELDRLREPIGKQDQFIAAFGGVTCFRFKKDDTVEVRPAPLSTETLHNLEDGLVMFFTGMARAASSILLDQDDKSKANDRSIIDNLHYVKDLGVRSSRRLSPAISTNSACLWTSTGTTRRSAPARYPTPKLINGTSWPGQWRGGRKAHRRRRRWFSPVLYRRQKAATTRNA